jgi:hypothetical protein
MQTALLLPFLQAQLSCNQPNSIQNTNHPSPGFGVCFCWALLLLLPQQILRLKSAHAFGNITTSMRAMKYPANTCANTTQGIHMAWMVPPSGAVAGRAVALADMVVAAAAATVGSP